MIVKDDHSLVTVRPKHYAGSGGSVWASENVFLRWEHPQLYEVEITSLHSALRKYAAMVWDHLSYFIDSTEKEDVLSVTSDPKCLFR